MNIQLAARETSVITLTTRKSLGIIVPVNINLKMSLVIKPLSTFVAIVLELYISTVCSFYMVMSTFLKTNVESHFLHLNGSLS